MRHLQGDVHLAAAAHLEAPLAGLQEGGSSAQVGCSRQDTGLACSARVPSTAHAEFVAGSVRRALRLHCPAQLTGRQVGPSTVLFHVVGQHDTRPTFSAFTTNCAPGTLSCTSFSSSLALQAQGRRVRELAQRKRAGSACANSTLLPRSMHWSCIQHAYIWTPSQKAACHFQRGQRHSPMI